MRLAIALVSAAALAPAIATTTPPPKVDHVYVNARVWTGADAAAAEAFAIRGDRFVAVGTSERIRALAGPATPVTDLGGRRVVPGFDDAHWHLPSRRQADLADAGSVPEIERRLREYARALPRGAWVLGRGWSPSDFPGNRAHKAFLDKLFPDRPVALRDRDGHQLLASSRALAMAKIDAETPDPERGRIDRDDEGRPTGLLKEAAAALVQRLVPPPSAAEILASLRAEMARAASFGLTTLQEASGNDPNGATFDALRRARDEGLLLVRFRASIPFQRKPSRSDLDRYLAARDRETSPLLRVGIAKGMLDGTVDAKTAAMLEPFTGGENGLLFWSQADLDAAVTAYDAAGLQVGLHAIGDAAIRMALDAYERAATVNGTRPRRHRVEHIEVPALADVPRFQRLGVIASTQAIFASPDAPTLQNYAPILGPGRASRSNAFRIFDDAGAVQAFGSDYPVFTMDVLRGIYTAATRQMPDGTPAGGWYPEHRIAVEAALRHYTRDAAYASFDEKERGTIEEGKLADFVVLSDDILSLPPERLLGAKVLLTVMGGRPTHRDPSLR